MKYIFLTTIFILFLFPPLLTLTNSLMSDSEISYRYNNKEMKPGLIPEFLSLKQYGIVLFKSPLYLIMFWNTIFITVPLIAGQVVIGSMMGFALGKLKFKFRDEFFIIIVIAMMMPFQVLMVPNYIVINFLNLLNSRSAIIIPGIFSAFGIFLSRQFIIQIPDEILEAGRCEGASDINIFFNIVLPLSKSAIISLSILTLIETWNLLEKPFLFIHDIDKQPLSLMLSFINRDDRGIAFAAGVIFMFPVFMIIIRLQRELVNGIIHTGIKG